MKSLKSKASRFFTDSSSRDEKVAHAESADSVDFDAGIHGHVVKKKASRFFTRKNDKVDKPLPGPPSNASSSTLVVGEERRVCHDSTESTLFRSPQESLVFSNPSGNDQCSPDLEDNLTKVKPRPSFATLRSRSSRLFRNNYNENRPSPPPPPPPQISVDPVQPQPRHPTLTSLHAAHNSRSSIALGHNSSFSISRPTLLTQYSSPPIPKIPITVPFNKPLGPPPHRPPRPETLDEETIALMQQGGSRIVLFTNNRISDSTASSTTPRSYTSSIEARLGLPSGHSTPRTGSLDSPLAARFPPDISQPLQVRDSAGSVTVSRFSQWVRNECGGYASDGVEEEDRDLGPIEQYDRSKEGQWKLAKRVSKGPNGNPGMLFRDSMGAFHFVADI